MIEIPEPSGSSHNTQPRPTEAIRDRLSDPARHEPAEQPLPDPRFAGTSNWATKPRYCRRCAHRLPAYRRVGDDAPRCPECELPYNPFDPTTFDRLPPPNRWKFRLSALALTILYGITAYA